MTLVLYDNKKVVVPADDGLLPKVEADSPPAMPAHGLRAVPGVAQRDLLPLEAGYIAVIHDSFLGRYPVRDIDAGAGGGGHDFNVFQVPRFILVGYAAVDNQRINRGIAVQFALV